MLSVPILIILIVVCALVFDYINGFHDTANAIATVVSTRVLSPRTAIIMAACLNFVGAFMSTNVAKTVAGGLLDTSRIKVEEIHHPDALAATLKAPKDAVAVYLSDQLSPNTKALLAGYDGVAMPSRKLQTSIIADLNVVIKRPGLYSAQRFAHVPFKGSTAEKIKNLKKLKPDEIPGLNRALLETALPTELSSNAMAFHVVILAAVLGAIAWNLITWKLGIPSSSSHALIGGMCGAAMVHGGVDLVLWDGILHKVVYPLFGSPLMGFLIGFMLMSVIFRVLANTHPGRVSSTFKHLQIFSAAAMALTHGQNDAQKSMGIITMALLSAHLIPDSNIPKWVILCCAVAMALGTSAGGWRIIKTMGHKIIRLEPVHGFAAETSSAIVLTVASHLGMPVSTTHVISGSIFGVGSSKRFSAVRWGVAQNMVVAWVLTLPAAALVSAAAYELLLACGVGR